MAAEYDATEFIDTDFQAHKLPATGGDGLRAPSREEVDRKVVEAQQKLAELKRAQEELERERSTLEELRRGVASTLPGEGAEQRLTLEEIFLSIVGASGGEPVQELSWLT